MYILLLLIMMQVPYSWYKVHILTRNYEKFHGFCQFWQRMSCNFEKKLFLLGVIVSVNRPRKDIKVTLVSAAIQEGLQWFEKNMETSYFHILTFSNAFRRILLWIQELQSISRVTEVCSFTSALLILIWLSFKKIEKRNFSSNPCF